MSKKCVCDKLSTSSISALGCGKNHLQTVYSMEAVKSGELWFHKTCFKCAGCAAALAKGKEQVRDGKVYCAKCHSGLEGHKGYGVSLAVDSHVYNRAANPAALDK